MSDSCNCGTGLGNTGLASCLAELKEVVSLIAVQTYKEDGTFNRIATSQTINEAFVTALINSADTSERWYPLANLENIGGERADSVFNTSNAGTKKFVKKGVRNFTAEVWSGGVALLNKIEGNRCVEFSVYQVDADGKLVGLNKGDGYIYPIRVQKSTFDAKYMANNGADAEKIMISFDWDKREKDSELDYFTTATDIDLTDVRGLIDIYSTISSISTTSFKAKLTNSFGAVNDRGVLKGLVAGDFALYNVTDSSAVTILTAVESPDGTYTFTFSSQTSADVLRLTPTKDGYDFTNVVATTILIP